MHRKRVTSELHDSYFRLMTIKHSISKIEWAIVWELNYYITQSRRELRQLSSDQRVRVPVEISCDRESHTRPKGPGALMRWGPEKTLIRCRASGWASGERERHNVDDHKYGVKILLFLFGLQLPLTRKPWTTLSNPYNKVRGIYFYKEVFLRLYYCVVMIQHMRI